MDDSSSREKIRNVPICFILGVLPVSGILIEVCTNGEYDSFVLISVLLFLFGPALLCYLDYRIRNIDRRPWRIITICWLILAFLFLVVAAPQMLGSRRSAWGNRAKLTIRALTSTQLAFQHDNHGEFGTWDELLEGDYIDAGYTRSNMIDNYSMCVFDVHPTRRGEKDVIITRSSFTIVAIPRRQSRKLRTFAICEDERVREWIGDPVYFDADNIQLNNPDNWKPLR